MMDPFAENEFCSPYCFKQASNIETVVARQWTTAQIDLLRTSAGVLRNNPRCACLCAAIINKPCAEIYIRLGEENLLPLKTSDEILGNSEAPHPEPMKVLRRKKTPAGFLTGYPADTDRTHLHQERPDVHPCRHVGPCNNSCECVRNHVTCEKACACPPNCPRKWRGCSCKRGGRPCTSDKCICFKANRECDPDLCGTCGAYEILDPVNRYNWSITTPDMCQNVCIQREMSKKTLLGHSVVSGMGLFICEDVPKGGYIGEYKGEIVTNEEAERRGKLYDKRGTSFLFTLNLAQAIDATRMGNKFRFINHSHQRPNCQAKVTMANCAHRIGFYATRALRAGEELFFDYGYNQKCVKFVQKEPPPLPRDIVSSDEENLMPPKAARGRGEVEKPHRARGPPEYLKGGKGTTERSRNYASPSIPESAGTPSAAQPSLSPEPSRRAVARAKRGRKRKRANSDYVRDSSPDVPPVEVEQEEEAPQQQLSDDELSEYEETQEEIGGEEEEGQEESESDHARPPLKRIRRSERIVEEEPQVKRPRGRWSGGGGYNLWRSERRVRRF
ncbi:SET domain-containing protein [Wilcoxina mikolae CBS 423.85]|nr:SET domain-containing protein [Wilcoxina mikolae CBS 423.85]